MRQFSSVRLGDVVVAEHHGRISGLGKVQDDERADRPGVCTCTVRHDLDRGLALLRGLDQVPKLPAHHANAADDAMDDRFVDHGPQPRPLMAGQDFLPGLADFKQALDLIGVQLYRTVSEDLPRVVRGLQ
jgi:hypothetical protein